MRSSLEKTRWPGAARVCSTLALGALAMHGQQSSAATIKPAESCAPMLAHADLHPEAACFALSYKGRVRTFRVYSKLRGHEPAPVLIVLHGGGGSGADMEWITRRGFNRIADREGVIVVYPDGIGRLWSDGRNRGVDDLGFLRALPRSIGSRFPVDPLRVYATGFSSGGVTSLRLACSAADVYSAVAAVAANLSRDLAARCKPARPISVAIIDGTEDTVMPWRGGPPGAPEGMRGEVLSADATAARWLRLNHCDALHAGEQIQMQGNDQTTVIPRSAKCLDHTEVQLYEVQGGGHTWPSGEPSLDDQLVGRVSREIDANEVIWSFLVQHRLGDAAEETRL